jgi:hypothetical protein
MVDPARFPFVRALHRERFWREWRREKLNGTTMSEADRDVVVQRAGTNILLALGQAQAAAEKCKPRMNAGTEGLLGSIDFNTYASQGGGAKQYAYAKAVLVGLKATWHMIPRRIEERDGNRWVVIVPCEGIDLEILRHIQPHMRAQVMAVLQAGCNPRVFWPTLPHGWEEDNNLDSFGRDLRRED